MDKGTTFSYTSIAEGLWNSGKALDSRVLAGALQSVGAEPRQLALALKFNKGISLNNEQIADALRNGTSFNWNQIADALYSGLGGISVYRLAVILLSVGAGSDNTVSAVDSATGFSKTEAYALVYFQIPVKDLISRINNQARSAVREAEEVYSDIKENAVREAKSIGSAIDRITPPAVDSFLKGSLELATNPLKIVEVGERLLSPLKDEAFDLLARYNPVSNLIKQSPFGQIQDFIQSRLDSLSSTIHDVLKSANKPQTDAANTVLYLLEGEFKNAWNSFKGSSTIQSLLSAGKSALSGNFEAAGKSFLKGLGIDLPAPIEKGVDRLLKSSKAPKEGIYQLLSTTGVSVKTLKAAAGEPGYTADDQAHAIFNILAYPNIPFVSQIALAIDSGYYLSEATKQLTIPEKQSEAVKKLLTGAVSAAKVQNAADWVNAAWSLNLSSMRRSLIKLRQDNKSRCWADFI